MPTNKQKVLNALAFFHVRHGMEVPKKNVLSLTKLPESSYAPLISRMGKESIVERGSTPSTLKITQAGLNQTETIEMPTSDKEAHPEIMKELGGKALQIFQFLSDGKTYTKQAVMKAVDCTNPKTFRPLVSRVLKKTGCVEHPSKGTIRLTNLCFPIEGRPE